jgi:RNA polymerase sigma-70 factor (ECF subfamily)
VRSRARLALAAEAAVAAAQAPAAPGAESRLMARAAVRAALAELPPRRRAVVVLHEIEELPVREIAALLGIAGVTVRWHLLAARRQLATRLLVAGGAMPAAATKGAVKR